MSRRRAADKRQILPDPIYNSIVLNKFINEVMVGGKKTVAQKIVYGALDIIQAQNQSEDPLDYFQKSINNVKPSVCLLYTSPSPRDATLSRMPSSA